MFGKLFGGSKKPEPPKQPPPQAPRPPGLSDREIQAAQTLNSLNVKVAQAEEEIDILAKKIEQMEQEVKNLVMQKKKTQAQTKLLEVKAKRELLTKKEGAKNMLLKAKIGLESQMENVKMKDTLKDVNEFMKQTENVNDDLLEQVEEFKSNQSEMNQADEYLKQLMAPDAREQAELDNELAEIEKQIKMEEAAKVGATLDMLPPTGIKAPMQAQPIAQPQSRNVDKFTSALEDTLNQ